MKKFLILATAICMVVGSLGSAAAIDTKVSGQWEFHYGYYSSNTLLNNSDTGTHQDRLMFRQRFRTQVNFIADENLSGMLNFEIGDLDWGNNTIDASSSARQGGGLTADGYTIKVKWAYVDWTLPGTQTKTRMGIQPFRLPSAAFSNPVLGADAAGVSFNTGLTSTVGLSGFWMRPYSIANIATTGQVNGQNNLDDMDVFALTLPIKTDAVRITPYAMFALIGKDSGYYGNNATGTGLNRIRATGPTGVYSGGRPIGARTGMDSTGYAWWGGTSFDLPLIDPFFVKLDAMVGGLETGDKNYDSFGYFLIGDMGYKFSFGSLSAIGWYSSGDKKKDERGIIPSLSDDTGFTILRYGLGAAKFRSYDDVLGTNGYGMWGAGLKLANVSFIDKLTHAIQAVYMRGTNTGESLFGTGAGNKAAWNTGGKLLTSDSAIEVDFSNEYAFTKNFTMALDFVYLKLDLGPQRTNKNADTPTFSTMLGFQYKF